MKKNNTAEKSILEAEKLSQALKEGTKNSLKDIMNEAINKLIMESDEENEDSFEEEDVNTEEEPKNDDTQCVCDDNGDCHCEDNATPEENDTEDGGDDEWSDMEQYKVGDNDYDFTGVDGDEILKVYNKLGDDDQIFVKKDEDGNYEVKDEETGAEYVIELNNADEDDEDSEFGMDDEGDGFDIELETGDDEDDNFGSDDEEMEFEFDNDDEDDDEEMLNEENLGYTNNYQKDVMPGLKMNEPANKKATYSMDGGAPDGNKRPYSGYENKESNLFTKKVNECGDATASTELESEPTLDEAGHNVGGFVQQRTSPISQGTNSGSDSGRQENTRNGRVAGDVKNGTAISIKESFVNGLIAKAKEIQLENQKYAKALENIKESVSKAALLNVNLSQMVKLLSENTTSSEEKKSIVERFTNVKTIRESKNLYDTIKRELNEGTKSSVVLEKQISASGSKMLNETTMYQRTSNPSLNLMDRLENLYKN